MYLEFEEPVVEIPDGLLRGRIVESVLGEPYFSFQGIPYAQPPVGPLRFKPPQRVEPWSGERSALTEGNSAPALVATAPTAPLRYLESSSEDCLYLNVYTKQLPGNKTMHKKAVMVWIHGGGFISGSGNSDWFGPDYILKENVVLVTINYRLGALGFLSLQNEACPGNNGLRDQVEALRWVKRSIAAFGGDENNVTIFGESAGGASVQYLMLSRQTQGLFHRAISQSGSALNPWAISRRPVQCAFALGRALGYARSNEDELLEFLRGLPAEDIVVKSEEVIVQAEPHLFYISWPFTPVVEPPSPDAILDVHPEELLRKGQVHDVPYMLGVVELEGPIMLKMREDIDILESKEEWERILPPHPAIHLGTPFANLILDQIKKFYFLDGFEEDKFIRALSWVYFLEGNDVALRGISNSLNRKSKTYFYQFTYDGGTSVLKAMWGLTGLKGTFHGDELSYLFFNKVSPTKHSEGSANAKVTDVMTQMWTDFANSGNPTPDDGLWPAFTNEDKRYLEIGEKLTVKKNLYEDESEFWSGIFEEIRSYVS